MSENLKAFLEAVKDDPELRERMTRMAADELVAVAREKGVELTEADLMPPTSEVDEAELGNVAAGGNGGGCFVGGLELGPDGLHGEHLCSCIFYGAGDDCLCPLVGAGWE